MVSTGTTIGSYRQMAEYYDNSVNKKNKQTEKAKNNHSEKAEYTGYVDRNNESKLSKNAQNLLQKLRSTYGDMDFMVADFDKGSEAREILSRGTKEFSVLFSSEELEKMASDEKYLQEKLRSIEGAVRMSEEISTVYGFENTFGKEETTESKITKIGISFHADGTTTFFAELEKSSAKQRERLEEARQEKLEEKTDEKRKADKERPSYPWNSTETKRTIVQADSMEELLDKIKQVDWNTIKSENKQESGTKFDFSI